MLPSPYNHPFGVVVPRKRGSNVKAPFSIIAVAAALTLALPAHATQQCASHEKATAYLYDKYKEAPIAAGLATNGTLIEVYAAHEGKTFTIIMTTPKGNTCFLTAGKDWVSFIKPVGEES
jgi:hypothetical protein